MLTFTGQLDKILDGTKTMTTRLDAKGWYFRTIAGGSVLDMWWQNPRTRKPDCYKIGRTVCYSLDRKTGAYFDQKDAEQDGFPTIREYKEALAKLNNMPWYEVDRTMWTQIRWVDQSGHAHWIDGPHPRKVA